MSHQEKIEILESRVIALGNENTALKSLLGKQVAFGNKMTQIVSEMDDLLEKKKQEIESLSNQLLEKSNLNDFSIDLEGSTSQIGFLERQRQVKMEKERLQKEFERTKDGKFKCPYKDICNYATRYRDNLHKHIRIHTGERPYRCDICGCDFKRQDHCKNHMLTHPEMKGELCNYCRKRIPEFEIENHQTKCWARKHRKPKRRASDSESSSNE